MRVSQRFHNMPTVGNGLFAVFGNLAGLHDHDALVSGLHSVSGSVNSQRFHTSFIKVICEVKKKHGNAKPTA